ncbi:MAG: AbrB/MazE/SpoVT family DNA-binding domain-containing protein [Nitrospinota bacterium]
MPSARTKAAKPKARKETQARKDTVKLRKVGGSLGVILPKEALDALNLKEGDEMFLLRTPEGVKLTPYDPRFARLLKFARDFMRRYRDDMRELAK